MEIHGIQPVGKRRIAVPLVRARIEHHAVLGRNERFHAGELPRRLRDDRSGKILPPDGLPRDLPLGDVAARRDGQKSGKRRVGLTVGVVDLRLEKDVRTRLAHRLAPHGKRLAARSAVSRRVNPLFAEPVRGAARPCADDEFLFKRLERLLPRRNRKRDLTSPVSGSPVLPTPVADAVESIIVPETDDHAGDLRHGNLTHGLAEESGSRRIARTKSPLFP